MCRQVKWKRCYEEWRMTPTYPAAILTKNKSKGLKGERAHLYSKSLMHDYGVFQNHSMEHSLTGKKWRKHRSPTPPPAPSQGQGGVADKIRQTKHMETTKNGQWKPLRDWRLTNSQSRLKPRIKACSSTRIPSSSVMDEQHRVFLEASRAGTDFFFLF